MDKHRLAFGKQKGPKFNKNNNCKFTTVMTALVLISLATIMMAFYFQRSKMTISTKSFDNVVSLYVSTTFKPTLGPVITHNH